MSYGRNPHYIYPSAEGVCFYTEGNVTISDAAMNAFLYKMLLMNRRNELAERLHKGREEWLKQTSVICVDENGNVLPKDNPSNWEHVKIVPMPHDDPEYQATVKWMEDQEDDIFKGLISIK